MIVSVFVQDAFSLQAERALQSLAGPVHVSDLGALEVSSAIARQVRTKELTTQQAQLALADFDDWRTKQIGARLEPTDFQAAEGYLRRLDLTLRGPDALHIAVAKRLGLPLWTFDQGMLASAGALGVSASQG